MTNEEILKKAIEKAHENGYDFNGKDAEWIYEDNQEYEHIFSHDFAKAFWKDTETDEYSREYGMNWQYHLQQMVLEEYPIEYLERFI